MNTPCNEKHTFGFLVNNRNLVTLQSKNYTIISYDR